MNKKLAEKVDVVASHRSITDSNHARSGWDHKRIKPLKIRRPSGKVLKVEKVLRAYPHQKGQQMQLHFNIVSNDGRYFHLVYESKNMIWILLYEFEETLFFDELDMEVEITLK
jgi:hypothetical protein